MGRVRTLTPVAAKIALVTAAATGGTAGSPRPPMCASERMNWTCTSGAPERISVLKSWKLLCATLPVGNRDFAQPRGGQAEHDAAFHLRRRGVGIDDVAAVHRGINGLHLQRPVWRNRDVRDLADD